MMNTNRNIARWMGILYIMGTVAGIFSRVLTAPLLNSEDILSRIPVIGNQFPLAALLVMTMGMALALVPVVAYPVLKQHDPILALGYVVFRGALEGAAYMSIVVSWLLLLPLSRVYQGGTADAANFQALAGTLLEAPELGAVLMVVFSLGGFMLYALLYQSRLVPRWLSVWGLLAILMNFGAGLLVMFGVFSPISEASTFLQVPIFFQELILAIWLIVKGFNPKVVTK
jgi:hypothetical protein